MRTPTREAESLPASAPPAPDRPLRSWLASGLLAVLLAGAVMGFFLWIFPSKHYTVPVGWDQSEYLWRTKYAQVVGLTHINEAPGSARSAKSGRPAFPVIAGTISSLGRISPMRLAMVLPSVMAIVIGLAAGAFVAGVLRRRWWELAVVALAVSLSPFVVRLMQPEAYMDNMFAAAVFLAAAIPLAIALEERWALVPAILMLGAGATIHWAFFGFMAAVLLLCGVAYLPASWKRWRSGQAGLLDTPTARIGESLVGGAAVGAGMIFAVLGNGLPKPRVDVSEFAKKLRKDLPKYKFPFTIPLAVLGGVALGLDARERREASRTRFVLAFLASWCLVVLAGYLGRTVLHLSIPAHRFLAFALAVPLLGALALLWLARLLERITPALAGAAIVLALVVSGAVAHSQWFQAKTWTDPAKIRDVGTVATYLEAARVPIDRPVVFIVGTRDWSAAALFGHMIRAGMPGDRIGDVYVYVGSAESYWAHQPVETRISQRYFQRVEPILPSHPIAVITDSFNDSNFAMWAEAHPESAIDPGVSVVEGPQPSTVASGVPSAGEPVGPASIPYLAALGAFAFVVLVGTGLGWSVALMGRWLRPVELVAVAPAVGVAALVLGGIVVDRVGIRLVGAGGAVTILLVAAGGWAAAWLIRLDRSPDRQPAVA
jgi:hypothetical protein